MAGRVVGNKCPLRLAYGANMDYTIVYASTGGGAVWLQPLVGAVEHLYEGLQKGA